MNPIDRIAGYRQEKEELKVLIDIFNNRDKYREKGAELPKGIILYGEAGTGKTLFAEVLASSCQLNIIRINIADAADEIHIGRAIRKAFAKGVKSKLPSMIFFDEIDKFLPNEEEEYYTDRSKSVLAQLLTLIDGMEASSNTVIVATCNSYDALPPSIVRPGRFDKKIALRLPDLSSRVAILKLYMSRSSCLFAKSAEEIAAMTQDFSCAALHTLVNECILRSDETNTVSEALIREKISEIKNEDLSRGRSRLNETVCACRNLGYFFTALGYHKKNYFLSTHDDTVCNGFFDALIRGCNDDDDYDEDEWDEDDKALETDEANGQNALSDEISLYTKADFLAAITVLLSGYAAEEIILHKVYHNIRDSFSEINEILLTMSESGMFGMKHVYLRYRNNVLPYPIAKIEQLDQLFDQTIEECYEKAKATVLMHQSLIETLMPILAERESFNREECLSLFATLGRSDLLA